MARKWSTIINCGSTVAKVVEKWWWSIHGIRVYWTLNGLRDHCPLVRYHSFIHSWTTSINNLDDGQLIFSSYRPPLLLMYKKCNDRLSKIDTRQKRIKSQNSVAKRTSSCTPPEEVLTVGSSMWLWKRWHFLDGFYLPVYHVFVRLASLTRNKSSVHSCILVASSLEYCALEEEYLTIAAVTVVLNWRLSLSGQIVFPVLVTMLMVLNKNPTVYSPAFKVFYTSIHWQNIFIVVKEEENFDMSHHHHHQLPCGQRRWGDH